jgi:D-alanyl-D-alanine carboxypeptidase
LTHAPHFIGGAALALCVLAAPLAANAKTVTDKSPYIVIDVDTGAVLADRQAGQPWYPASLTKLMTAYVTFQAMAEGRVSAATKVVESAVAAAEEPVKMGFPVGTKMSLDNALKMMIVPSANDIAVAVAEAISGTTGAFVDAMNAAAAQLGLAGTHFDNPNGLPTETEISTARDLAIVARQILTEFPEQRSLFGIQAIQSGDSVFHSPNLALLERYRGADGMKTGFTCEAGYNLAVTATRNGRTLLAVVLGRTSSSDRAELAARLLDDAFAAKTTADPAITLAAFSDAASDPGPVDMRICSGTGVDRVSFTQSVLGPVVVVTDPVKVLTDYDPALAPKPAPAKPATTQAASTGKSVASSAKPTPVSTGKSSSSATNAKNAAFAAAAETAAAAPLEDFSSRNQVFRVFSGEE